MEVEQCIIKIKCKDKVIEFPQKITEFSKLMQSISENGDIQGEIEMSQFTEKDLEILKRYLNMVNYKYPQYKIPMPLPSGDFQKFIPSKDYQFIKELSLNELRILNEIAYFMNIEALIEMTSAYIASFFKGKELEEISQDWGINMNINDEIEADLKQKYNHLFQDQQENENLQNK